MNGERLRTKRIILYVIGLLWLVLWISGRRMVAADDFEWRELFFEGFESAGPRWELTENWGIVAENGSNHVLRADGAGIAFLRSDAPWGNHRLLLRLKLDAGACHLLLRRQGEDGYELEITTTRLTLTRQAAGKNEVLATAAYTLQADRWYYVMVTMHEDHLMVAINGQEQINMVDLAPIWLGDFAILSDLGSHMDIDDLWITGLLPLPTTPPNVDRIQLGAPDADGIVSISGQTGAVPANATVYGLNPATLDLATCVASPDGSFQSALFAPAGATVQLNYGYAGAQPLFQSIGTEGSPALLLTVPAETAANEGLAYTIGGRLNGGHWVAHGTVTQKTYQPGETLTTTLHLRVNASQLEALDWNQIRVVAELAPLRLFDERGNQLPLIRNQVSALLTPSGLPIEAEQEVANPWQQSIIVAGTDCERQGDLLTVTIPITLPIPTYTPAGVYRPQLTLRFERQQADIWSPIDSLTWDDGYAMLERQDPQRTYPWPLLPPVTIGDPDAPRLTWALLCDYSSNSERGVRAQEDDHYSLSPRTVYATQQFILPMDGPYGEPLTYTLEPNLPLTAWGFRNLYERVTISPPSLPLDNSGGHVQITVQKPDGTTEAMADTALIAGLNPLMAYRADALDPTRHHRSQMPALDNPGPSDFYRAYSGDDSLAYRFDQYGCYTITLSGEMRDIWGNVYAAGGTYQVWIAKLLDLELGTLPGTPFEVGDTYAPTVRVQPALPAEISIAQTLYINSSTENTAHLTMSGQANDYGYYCPDASQGRFRLNAPGEYDVHVTASYWDGQGSLWMGSVRGASVVEAPDTALVAHGERGIRSFVAVKRPLWFAEGRYGNVVPGQTDGLFEERVLGGALHLPYPYITGDVMWLVDLQGQSSVFPTITFDDKRGEIADLLEARVPELSTGSYYYGQFPNQLLPIDRRAIGELPLVSVTSLGQQPEQTYGWPAGQFASYANQLGYFYTTCLRPGLGVAAQVSESGLGNAFWFADDPYNLQYGQGVNGDIAPDFKLNYGGLVFRDLKQGINQYAIYASADVYIPVGDEMSNRIMPPFQGAAGGPDGGPLLTVRGEAIDLFVHPTSIKPGTVLVVGDTLAFAAQIVPTLDSHLAVTITSPSGQQHVISGQANKIGFFYDPNQDVVIDEVGVYTVQVRAEHRGMTSAGLVYPPYPTGTVLGASEETFEIYVAPRGALPLAVDRPSSQLLSPTEPFTITGSCPAQWDTTEVRYCVALSDFVLEQGTLPVVDGAWQYTYDPLALHAMFPNLDTAIIHEHLTFMPWTEPEMVDTVQLTLAAQPVDASGALQARVLTLQGNQLLAPYPVLTTHLPMIWRN